MTYCWLFGLDLVALLDCFCLAVDLSAYFGPLLLLTLICCVCNTLWSTSAVPVSRSSRSVVLRLTALQYSGLSSLHLVSPSVSAYAKTRTFLLFVAGTAPHRLQLLPSAAFRGSSCILLHIST